MNREWSMSVFNCTSYALAVSDAVSASGCRVTDAVGGEYLDFESGVWCAVLGHGDKEVIRAVCGQFSALGHTGYAYSGAIVEKAARIFLKSRESPAAAASS